MPASFSLKSRKKKKNWPVADIYLLSGNIYICTSHLLDKDTNLSKAMSGSDFLISFDMYIVTTRCLETCYLFSCLLPVYNHSYTLKCVNLFESKIRTILFLSVSLLRKPGIECK